MPHMKLLMFRGVAKSNPLYRMRGYSPGFVELTLFFSPGFV